MAGPPLRLRNGHGLCWSPLQVCGRSSGAAEACPQGGAMAIYKMLQNTSLAESSHLFAAYELTLCALNLTDRNDPLTAMIAEKIIAIRSNRPPRPH